MTPQQTAEAVRDLMLAQDSASRSLGIEVIAIAPGRPGDRLTAVARELQRGNRTGLYDITVRNQRDELVAEFRGKSYALKGQTIVEGAAP